MIMINVNDKLKYEDYKKFLLSGSHITYEINRTQSKNHDIGSYRVNKVSLFCYVDKKYIPEANIISSHIFINLLVNYTKITSSSIDNLFQFLI